MNKPDLINYCEAHGISMPARATLAQINAAIVRASLHKSAKIGGNCFGFWGHEDMTCSTCDFESRCFETSLGCSKAEYFKSRPVGTKLARKSLKKG